MKLVKILLKSEKGNIVFRPECVDRPDKGKNFMINVKICREPRSDAWVPLRKATLTKFYNMTPLEKMQEAIAEVDWFLNLSWEVSAYIQNCDIELFVKLMVIFGGFYFPTIQHKIALRALLTTAVFEVETDDCCELITRPWMCKNPSVIKTAKRALRKNAPIRVNKVPWDETEDE